MQRALAPLTIVLALAAGACTHNSAGPTSSTTTTSVQATTTSTTSVATTSVPAQLTVTGKVTSEKTGDLLRFADIEIIQGANIGRRFQADDKGFYTMSGLNPGSFVMRVWADGYLIKDVLVTVQASDLTVDVQLTPAPTTTTTTVGGAPLQAIFRWSPDPCTIDGGTFNCVVDGGFSTGDVATYRWTYAGKDVTTSAILALSAGCGDFTGSGDIVTLNVKLTVTDSGGNASSTTVGVPVRRLNNSCP
jgi:hypothetical protein